MSEVKTLGVSFQGQPRPNLAFKSDVSRFPLSKLRDAVLKKYTVTQDPSPGAWNLYVNTRLISPFEAAAKSLRDFSFQEPILLELYSKKNPRQEGRAYNLTAKLTKTLRGNEKLIQTDLESNGMIDVQVMNVMGRFRNHMTELELPLSMDRIHFNMEFTTQPTPVYLLENPIRNKLVLSPYATRHHVALLAVFPDGKRLHVDASGSISRNNFLLMQKGCDYYTYINYQYADETNALGFAGGNCAVYTLLNMLRLVLHLDDYDGKVFSFEDFWLRFERVMALTIDTDKQQILNGVYYALLYMEKTDNGTHRGDYGQSFQSIMREFPIPPGEIVTKETLRGAAADGTSFLADCLMLDLLIVSNKGFHQITQLGNYLRELLKEISSYGFINSYNRFLGKPCIC